MSVPSKLPVFHVLTAVVFLFWIKCKGSDCFKFCSKIDTLLKISSTVSFMSFPWREPRRNCCDSVDKYGCCVCPHLLPWHLSFGYVTLGLHCREHLARKFRDFWNGLLMYFTHPRLGSHECLYVCKNVLQQYFKWSVGWNGKYTEDGRERGPIASVSPGAWKVGWDWMFPPVHSGICTGAIFIG